MVLELITCTVIVSKKRGYLDINASVAESFLHLNTTILTVSVVALASSCCYWDPTAPLITDSGQFSIC